MSSPNSLVSKAIAATDSFVVKLRNFVMLARDRSLVICVFEGDDHHYYGSRIDVLLPDGKIRRNFPMDGKGNLLELYKLRTENRDVANASALYFTDNDYNFDTPITQPRLYVTPCYSIENLYVTENTFRRILVDAFKLPPTIQSGDKIIPNSAHEKVVEHFNRTMRDLHIHYLVPISGFIIAAREKLLVQPELRQPGQLRVQQFSTNDYFSISSNKIEQRKAVTLDNLAQSLNAKDLVSEAEHQEKIKFLLGKDFVTACRGKYSFEALSTFMQLIWDDSKKTVPKIFETQKDAKSSFSRNTALADLSAYASTPECLKQFLRYELASI